MGGYVRSKYTVCKYGNIFDIGTSSRQRKWYIDVKKVADAIDRGKILITRKNQARQRHVNLWAKKNIRNT